jgi:hypothetical protein
VFNEFRKEGFSIRVSDFALKVFMRISFAEFESFTQNGIRPHVKIRILNGLSLQMTGNRGRENALILLPV